MENSTENVKRSGQHQFQVRVNGRKVDFDERHVTAREILDKAGFEGEFCLAATLGESGKVEQTFSDGDRVDLKKHKHFRATFGGCEVVA